MDSKRLHEYCNLYSGAWNLFLASVDHFAQAGTERFWEQLNESGNAYYAENKAVNKELAYELAKLTRKAIEDEYELYLETKTEFEYIQEELPFGNVKPR